MRARPKLGNGSQLRLELGEGVREAIAEPPVTQCQAPVLRQHPLCLLNDARGKEKAALGLLGKDLHRSVLTPPDPPLGVMSPPTPPHAGQG